MLHAIKFAINSKFASAYIIFYNRVSPLYSLLNVYTEQDSPSSKTVAVDNYGTLTIECELLGFHPVSPHLIFDFVIF